MKMDLIVPTPKWCLPLLKPCRFKGARGGRSGGKSHFFAEELVLDHVENPDLRTVCIREIQKSLKFSSRQLIVDKINQLEVGHLFKILETEIRNIKGDGVIIFQGMQDHTADSIKSLEGFDRCLVEEAQNISALSLERLTPTIRKKGSEIHFIWNPDQPDDPIEKFFEGWEDDPDYELVHVNYTDNPLCPEESKREAERMMKRDYERYAHVWLGGFNTKNDAQIFKDKWVVDEFEPDEEWLPLHGMDFGFSNDPNVAIRCYVENRNLYIYQEACKINLEIDKIAGFCESKIPGIGDYVIRADNARPETINYLKRDGLPQIQPVKKWPGSIEDGVEFMKSFDQIIVHPSCKYTQEEFRCYSYVVDKRTGDITKKIEDDYNHCIDAIRYALQPLIKKIPKKSIGAPVSQRQANWARI